MSNESHGPNRSALAAAVAERDAPGVVDRASCGPEDSLERRDLTDDLSATGAVLDDRTGASVQGDGVGAGLRIEDHRGGAHVERLRRADLEVARRPEAVAHAGLHGGDELPVEHGNGSTSGDVRRPAGDDRERVQVDPGGVTVTVHDPDRTGDVAVLDDEERASDVDHREAVHLGSAAVRRHDHRDFAVCDVGIGDRARGHGATGEGEGGDEGEGQDHGNSGGFEMQDLLRRRCPAGLHRIAVSEAVSWPDGDQSLSEPTAQTPNARRRRSRASCPSSRAPCDRRRGRPCRRSRRAGCSAASARRAAATASPRRGRRGERSSRNS